MSEFIDFIEDFLHDRLSDIDIGMIGRIESFDSMNMRADVTPLMKKKAGDTEIEYSTLKDIPVNFLLSGDYYIRPEYKKGDLVHIAFSTHDIEEALRDRKAVASQRIFSSENAFIVGGIAPSLPKWQAPTEFSEEGLLIGRKDGTAFSQYASDKMVHKFGDSIIKLDENGVDINGGALTVSNSSGGGE